MLYAAVFVFLITVGLGVGNFLGSINQITPYRSLPLLHGLLAVTGLLLLCIHIVTVGYSDFLLAILTILSLSTLGGLALLIFRLNNKRPPIILLILHPVFAIAGVILLITEVLP